MKCAVLSFCVFLSTVSFSQERTSLIIQKNVEASLTSLVSPILDSETGEETVYVNQLYVGENAKLYIQRPLTINAKKVILKSKGTIHTLGNSLTLKTEVFEALNFKPLESNLSDDQRKDLMGRIDTRHKEELHHGKNGVDKQSVADKGKNGESDGSHIEDPKEGSSGEKGEDGTEGKNAGSLTLYVKTFLGGYFDARGGNGGQGGKGGKGGPGGDGFPLETYASKWRNDVLWNEMTGEQIRFFNNGAKGGPGGQGGHGKKGGNGGNVSIFYKESDSSSEKILYIFNEGGKGGKEGKKGDGGEGGKGVTVSILKDSNRFGDIEGRLRKVVTAIGDIFLYHDGEDGAQGLLGQPGSHGEDGIAGEVTRPIQKYDF